MSKPSLDKLDRIGRNRLVDLGGGGDSGDSGELGDTATCSDTRTCGFDGNVENALKVLVIRLEDESELPEFELELEDEFELLEILELLHAAALLCDTTAGSSSGVVLSVPPPTSSLVHLLDELNGD
ncbi:hypothetical protein AGMMS49936_11380 [Endomicrobiia bacterium]|nr:hypothetical protein AGMMS49936_11380 [Endomicrobiia bacterium]